MLVIPSIDLQKGKSIRLKQGDFNQVSIFDSSPMELAKKYANQGAQRLHVVDLDGAQSGSPQQLPLVKSLAASGLNLQMGGGIRTLEHAKRVLAAGVTQLVIGSIAVTSPDLVLEIIQSLGPESLILALDVKIDRGIPKPSIHGWQTATENSLWDLAAFYEKLGIDTILCTDIAMDGMLQGPNYSLYEEAINRFPKIHWQASGGISTKEDLQKLSTLGLDGAIIGRALYETNTQGWFQSW